MRIIDADGHVLERDIPWADLLEAPYRERAPRVVKDNRGFSFVMIEGKLTPKPVGKACSFVGAPRNRNPEPTTGMTDPVQRFKDMDLEGIDTAVFFGTSPFLSLPFVEDKDLAAPLRGSTTTGWPATATLTRAAQGRSRCRRSRTRGVGQGIAPRGSRTKIRRRRHTTGVSVEEKSRSIPISIRSSPKLNA